jgi:hypothetical protein
VQKHAPWRKVLRQTRDGNRGFFRYFLRDSIGQNIQSVTAGSFGYTRLLSYGSVNVGGGSLLYAGEFNTENGPWDTAEDLRKFSGLLRYSQGTATDGVSATAMAYANSWNSSDQIALRAITTGQVGLFGEIDPTDGGDTSRFMLSIRFAHSDDNGMWKANAYVVKYTLNLFNNFTWFTTNPTLGDQFHQSDDRSIAAVQYRGRSMGPYSTYRAKQWSGCKPAMTTSMSV